MLHAGVLQTVILRAGSDGTSKHVFMQFDVLNSVKYKTVRLNGTLKHLFD